MFFGCFSTRRRSLVSPPDEAGAPPPDLSEASTSDYVQAPLHRPKASDISARRATATATAAATTTQPLPEHAATRIANRRASNWEDSSPEAGGARSSASCIAGRRATDMDGPPSDRSAGHPPDYGGSSWGWMSKIAACIVTGADRQKMRKKVKLSPECWPPKDVPDLSITSRTFTFRELAAATLNFSDKCFLGGGGFGLVYKGHLQDGQVVAVKALDKDGSQHKQFAVEVLTLSRLHHPNLVNLIGHCADGDQRLLVYEYMPLGSLEDHLHDLPLDREPLDWNTRLKIAAGAARGLEYLHDEANPPVIYRDFKPSNILLDGEYHPKLSDFGLAKHAPTGDKSHTTTQVRGTFGFCAPEYGMTGHLTKKSDVYSFGVVLLELITGRKVIDSTRPPPEQNLVEWARPLCHDQCKFIELADPRLQGQFPRQGLYRALEIASMCIQANAAARPVIGDVVNALSNLANEAYNPNPNAKYDKTRVKEVGGSGRKSDLEGSEGEDSPRDTASGLHGSSEREDFPSS